MLCCFHTITIFIGRKHTNALSSLYKHLFLKASHQIRTILRYNQFFHSSQPHSSQYKKFQNLPKISLSTYLFINFKPYFNSTYKINPTFKSVVQFLLWPTHMRWSGTMVALCRSPGNQSVVGLISAKRSYKQGLLSSTIPWVILNPDSSVDV